MSAGVLSPGDAAVVDALLPGIGTDRARVAVGGSHRVVLLPDVAAVRIARTTDAEWTLSRRTALLERLSSESLPFAIPRPLGPVTRLGGQVAVALSWVDGKPAPARHGDPERLRAVLEALAAVDLTGVAPFLDRAHCYAGGDRWPDLMLGRAVPLLPPRLRAAGARRVEAALELEPVRPQLVHGDLAGHNMHWSKAGEIIGVVDWDLAQAFDPAVDVACLGQWHGWAVIRRVVDARTYRRARVWAGTFALEQLVRAVLDDADSDRLESLLERVVKWLDTDGLG